MHEIENDKTSTIVIHKLSSQLSTCFSSRIHIFPNFPIAKNKPQKPVDIKM